jgi:serine/threonine-protein kinase
MFTGQVPFFHAELVPLLMMHVNDTPAPPRRRNPNVPVELDAVIVKSLAKDPQQRQQSCRELAQELIAIRDRYA